MEESIQIDSHAVTKPTANNAEENGEDIISNLPESIISLILSLLPTKYAVRTCVLSKDWEDKWTSIYNVDIFNDDRVRSSYGTTRKTRFVYFVDRIFTFSQTSILKRFRLWCGPECDAHHIMTWISSALMKNTEDLEIVYNCKGVDLPRELFDCITLTRLMLDSPCTLRPVQNWFSNLKVLILYRVEILNDRAQDIGQLVFNFPVLETLELGDCKWSKVDFVEIKAPALTNFRVMHCSYLSVSENCHIKISGAKLLKIWFYGDLIENFDVSESLVISVLVDFRLCIHFLQGISENGSNARFLLNGCSSLNHLQLSGDIVEAIAKSEEGPPLPKLYMLKRLELLTQCKTSALLKLLHMMPFLESIVLFS